MESSFDGLLAKIRTTVSENSSKLANCEKELKNCSASETKLKAEEKVLAERKEASPIYNDFDLLTEDLDEALINYCPVYKGLEWHPDMTREQKGRVEELIGNEILSIITVSEDSFDEAAGIVLKNHPGHRLTVARPGPEPAKEFRTWASRVFDVKACNPQVLDVLLRELSAARPPVFDKWKGIPTAVFRSHVRSFNELDSRFIGADSRKKEQKRKLKEMADELREITDMMAKLENEHKELSSRLKVLGGLETLFAQAVKDLRENSQAREQIQLSMKFQKSNLADSEQKTDHLSEDIEKDTHHLETLQKLIGKKDMAALARKMKEVEEQIEKCRREIEEEKKSRYRAEIQIDEARKRIEKNELSHDACKVCLEKKLSLLGKVHGQPDPVSLIEKLRAEKRLHLETDAARMASECRQKIVARQTEIKIRIMEMIGAGYGFSYDIENNQLFTRSGVLARSIKESLQKNVDDQRELISEKTTELFKKLIMDTLLRTLWNNVHGLDKMVGDINKLLKNRLFGNSSYRIRVKPREEYDELVKLIKSFAQYNPEKEVKLRRFFEDRKEMLINTPPGTIPEMLDYRNWYRYEMCIHGRSGNDTVMDSKVKSIGSGGEQAVPNYLLILTIANFLYSGSKIRLNILLFDEAFYGIDAQRRDQLMGFATDLGLQLFVASPDQDGVKDEIACSTSLLIVKDAKHDVHLYPFDWKRVPDPDLFDPKKGEKEVRFDQEI